MCMALFIIIIIMIIYYLILSKWQCTDYSSTILWWLSAIEFILQIYPLPSPSPFPHVHIYDNNIVIIY